MPRRLAPLAVVLAALLPAAAAEGSAKEVKKLEKQLKDREARTRAEAAWRLGQLGATESVPALAAALADSSASVRANAAASLWKLGDASRPAEPALRRALDDLDSAVVYNAAGALAKLGVPAAELVPAYRGLLARPDCDARVRGLKGLVDEVPPTELFDHAWECSEAAEDADARSDALKALRRLVTRRDRVMVPRILETLKSLGGRDGSDLALAIGQQDPPVKEAVPVLSGLLKARNERTRAAAASALGRMGGASLSALPALIECLASDADPETREDAAQAIGEIGPKGAKSAVPALLKAAQEDKWPKVRTAAFRALGEMRESARSAIPVLRAALEDPDGFVSQAARNALFRVDPKNAAEAADIMDQSRPVQSGSLFEDLAQLSSTLPGRVPEAFEITIYDDFAMATAAVPSSRTGYGRFTYRAGTVTGPEEGSHTCDKRVTLAKVDFSIVPKLIAQARSSLGSPGGKVTHVTLGGDVFCKKVGWLVFLDGVGFVQFKLDGKVDKVQRL